MALKAYGFNLRLYLAAKINWPGSTGILFFALSPKTVKAGSHIYFIIHGAGRKGLQWSGQKYLSSMNLDQTLEEIDRAHTMGIEVFVIDAGWFKKTGDWR